MSKIKQDDADGQAHLHMVTGYLLCVLVSTAMRITVDCVLPDDAGLAEQIRVPAAVMVAAYGALIAFSTVFGKPKLPLRLVKTVNAVLALSLTVTALAIASELMKP